MKYKKPDRSKSRVRRKSFNLVDYHFIKEFKNKHPEHDMTRSEFNMIIRHFNENIVDAVVDNTDGLQLPERLGFLQIIGCPRPKGKVINYGKSNETGVVHYHKNWDTDNKLAKILFKNKLKGYSIKNNRFWGLETSRLFKEKASAAFKACFSKYIYKENY